MSNYTIEDIKKLREATGAGTIACKNALENSKGDYNKALEIMLQPEIEREKKARDAEENFLQRKREAAIENKSSEKMSNLQSDIEILQREVAALKKAHNALIAALEKAQKTSPGRTTTSYTGFFMGEF